jgi:hypothetical protein
MPGWRGGACTAEHWRALLPWLGDCTAALCCLGWGLHCRALLPRRGVAGPRGSGRAAAARAHRMPASRLRCWPKSVTGTCMGQMYCTRPEEQRREGEWRGCIAIALAGAAAAHETAMSTVVGTALFKRSVDGHLYCTRDSAGTDGGTVHMLARPLGRAYAVALPAPARAQQVPTRARMHPGGGGRRGRWPWLRSHGTLRGGGCARQAWQA